jgi:hypothetical protein
MLTLSRFIGPHISKYAQTTQDKVDYHVYPSGTRVIKAFTTNDFIFYDKSGHVHKKIDNSTLDLATSGQITWRIQKNRRTNYSSSCILPLVRRVQTRPLKPLSHHFASQPIVLDELSIQSTINGRPGALFMFA